MQQSRRKAREEFRKPSRGLTLGQPDGRDPYYFDGEGILQTSWQEIDSARYYFSPTTDQRLECVTEVIGGVEYTFDENG